MAAKTNVVTFEEAAARIGILPILDPRPNAKNIRALMKALVETVQDILSYQSTKYGYMGMVVTPEEYVLTGEPPWQDFVDHVWLPQGARRKFKQTKGQRSPISGGESHLYCPGECTRRN